MIANGGHRLAFNVIPGRLPAVVMDAGGGEDSSYWAKTAPALAQKTGSMVVTYDRAGLGKSDEVPGPWKVENAMSDLKAGLTRLGIVREVGLAAERPGDRDRLGDRPEVILEAVGRTLKTVAAGAAKH